MSRSAGIAVFTAIILGAACAHLPPLSPLPATDQASARARCWQAFPPQPWRATHTILATLPFGNNGALIGVTAVSREGLQAVLLSPEGITLFDATQSADGRGRPTVRRAVPPLDRFDFAASLLADVGNAFLPPGGEPAAIGAYPTGETVCRWTPTRTEATEVELTAAGPARIRTYRNARLSRQIDLLGVADNGFFPEVRLTVPGAGGYTLDMHLVDHE
jgi:hypothetical protein